MNELPELFDEGYQMSTQGMYILLAIPYIHIPNADCGFAFALAFALASGFGFAFGFAFPFALPCPVPLPLAFAFALAFPFAPQSWDFPQADLRATLWTGRQNSKKITI